MGGLFHNLRHPRRRYVVCAVPRLRLTLETSLRPTATSNEVFGFKLMSWYVDDFLARLRETRAFGDVGTDDLGHV